MPTSPLYTGNATWADDPPSETTPILAANLEVIEAGILGAYQNTLHVAETATDIAGIFRGAASQTGNLLEVQKSDATILARFNKDGALLVNPALASVVPLTLKGAAAQSGNLTEWQNSAGTIMSRVDSAGAVTIGASGEAAYLRLISGSAVTSSQGVLTAAGTEVIRANKYGDIICGNKALSNGWDSNSSSSTLNDSAVFDFAYLAYTRRLHTRSLLLKDVGDTVDLGIWRAEGATIDSTPTGLLTNTGIGSIYWQAGLAATAGGTMTRWGSRGRAMSQISTYSRENCLYNVGGDGKERNGGDLTIHTFPTYADFTTYGLNYGSTDIGDFKHLVVTHHGVVGVFGFGITDYTNYTSHSGLSPGDLFVQGGLLMLEKASAANPPTNCAQLYLKDNGGSTQLRILYANGNDNLLDSG